MSRAAGDDSNKPTPTTTRQRRRTGERQADDEPKGEDTTQAPAHAISSDAHEGPITSGIRHNKETVAAVSRKPGPTPSPPERGRSERSEQVGVLGGAARRSLAAADPHPALPLAGGG